MLAAPAFGRRSAVHERERVESTAHLNNKKSSCRRCSAVTNDRWKCKPTPRFPTPLKKKVTTVGHQKAKDNKARHLWRTSPLQILLGRHCSELALLKKTAQLTCPCQLLPQPPGETTRPLPAFNEKFQRVLGKHRNRQCTVALFILSDSLISFQPAS